MRFTRRNPLSFERLSPVAGLLLLLSLWPVPATSQDRDIPQVSTRARVPRYDPGNPVTRKVLKNGVVLVVQELRTGSGVSGMVGLRMGTLYESEDQAGYFQILMKTIGTGTATHSAPELELELRAAELSLESDVAAGQGHVAITGTRERVDRLIDLLAEITIEPSFPESTFDRAKRICMVRAASELEDPIRSTYAMFLSALYRGSSLARPVVGDVRSISECRRTDLVELHRRFFVGSNLVVGLVGNFRAADVVERLEKRFGRVPAGPVPTPESSGLMPLSADTTVVGERNYLAQSLVYGFAAPGYLDPDHPAFRLIESYLRAPDRSPLAFWMQQREEASAVGVLYPPYPNRSSIAVHLGTSPEKYAAARDTVAAVLRRLAVEPLDETEWFTHVDRTIEGFLWQQNDPRTRVARMTEHEVMGLGFDYVQRLELAILALTPEAVRDAAGRWFTHSCEASIRPVASGSKP